MPANDAEHTLYLIDGHAQMFRAFYAIRSPMKSPVTGEPTNATFAFTGMLIKLFEQFRPQYVAMPIDSPGENFRHELFPEYKATRQAPPEEFIKQIPRMLEIAELFGIPVLAEPAAEADDIIATLTRRTLDDPDHGRVQVRIVSRDKDLLQLLGERVVMIDIHKDQIIDPPKLEQDKGILPGQVPEMLMLMGDTVDNIPGVEKVGEKTAAKLLAEWGSIDNLLANIDKIKGKRRDYIEAAAPNFPMTRKLVVLNDHVPLEFDMDDARVGRIDADALLSLFGQLGFNRHQTDLQRLLAQSKKQAVVGGGLFADLPDEPEPVEITSGGGDYRAVTTA